MKVEYPSQFLWGTATSAFQIEGRIDNDMTQWEAVGGFCRDGYDPRAGDAVDHWRRWESDFRLLKDLGVNSYRFSIEWSRIEPVPGQFNRSAIAQYRQMIETLLAMGITPMITLLHFSHPSWFHMLSPWHKPESVVAFSRFVREISATLLRGVPLVVTLNEPVVWALAAYGEGRFPPGQCDLGRLMAALHNLLLAHRAAYDIIKGEHPDCQVGIAKNFIVFRRDRPRSFADQRIKRLLKYFYNIMLIESFQTNRLAIKFPLVLSYDRPVSLDDRIDFWGINYYYRLHVRFRLNLQRPFDLLFVPRSGEGLSDLGWEIYPRGLRRVAKWLQFTNKPLYITENGVAAENDTIRISFLKKHIRVVDHLVKNGYPIRGYYHWSLLDNYEWLVGYQAQFGLYAVDRKDGLQRSAKPSAAFFREAVLARLADFSG
jgi:beta-glucosidase